MTVTADSLEPILVIAEPSLLVRALLVPDSAGIAAGTVTASLYKLGPDGSTTTAVLLASFDGTAASASAWSALRPKEMLLATPAQQLSKGDVLAFSKTSSWTGCLSLRLGRVVE